MSSLPIWAIVLLFVGAAVVIWRAGTHLEQRVDQIARRTGLGQAFSGVLLLATATSLPELATTLSALVIHDNATLAVHNLLGGVALQTGLLVIADATTRQRGALTSFEPRFVLLIQGVGLIMLLQIVIAGWTAGGAPTLAGVSVWSALLVCVHVAILFLTNKYRTNPRWTPSDVDDYPKDTPPSDDEQGGPDAADHADVPPLRTLWLRFAGAALLVLVAGWLASGAADAFAKQTGASSALLGATVLALATSLPELSTTITAARAGRYTAAISNVFGSNAFDVALLFVADVVYRQGSLLAQAEPSIVFVATIGALMTCVYLWGLMERRDRTIGRIGWDSAIALVTYTVGVVVLYVVW
jgi:cation:H+ antiporter